MFSLVSSLTTPDPVTCILIAWSTFMMGSLCCPAFTSPPLGCFFKVSESTNNLGFAVQNYGKVDIFTQNLVKSVGIRFDGLFSLPSLKYLVSR